ncbi:hypothetical protein Tco_0011456 [Tanacetum coccineum]
MVSESAKMVATYSEVHRAWAGEWSLTQETMEQPRVPQARARMRPSKEWPMMAYDSRWTLMCTDISKITRKRKNRASTAYGTKRKSEQKPEAKARKSQASVKSWSTKGACIFDFELLQSASAGTLAVPAVTFSFKFSKNGCSIGSLGNKILVPEFESSPCCAKCGTPVDGPYCHGCALLRKKFEEDLLTYSNLDNDLLMFSNHLTPQFEAYLCELCGNNVHYGYDCSPQFTFVYEQEPFDQPQPPQDSVYCQEALDKILEELEELKRDQRTLKELKKRIAEEQMAKEDMSVEEMRHEQQLVDYKIKEIMNDLGINRYRARRLKRIKRDCEIRIRKLKQDFNEWGSEEKIIAPINLHLKAITPDLPIEEPDNSLNMGDEHLDTIPATESDEIDPILEEFAGELAHIPPGIVEADFDPNDDTLSDNDDFEDIEYISLEEVNDVDQEEKEFDLEDIFQIQDVILCEKLLNVHRLISNIESLKVNSTPDHVLKSPSPFPIPVADSDSFLEESDTFLSHLDNSLPEFETFSDHTEETRSGSTTTHVNYSFLEYDSFLF